MRNNVIFYIFLSSCSIYTNKHVEINDSLKLTTYMYESLTFLNKKILLSYFKDPLFRRFILFCTTGASFNLLVYVSLEERVRQRVDGAV